jgi:hypothetical protein
MGTSDLQRGRTRSVYADAVAGLDNGSARAVRACQAACDRRCRRATEGVPICFAALHAASSDIT